MMIINALLHELDCLSVFNDLSRHKNFPDLLSSDVEAVH